MQEGSNKFSVMCSIISIKSMGSVLAVENVKNHSGQNVRDNPNLEK